MPQDPLTSYEQAEAEADDRFYEERDDTDAAITAAQAHLQRRRALWNARCRSSCPMHLCQCIARCETCGHIRADHDYSGDEVQAAWGGCEVDDCICTRFALDYDE